MRRGTFLKSILCIGAISIAGAVPMAVAQTATHAEYVAQVNPICKKAAAQAKRIPGRIESSDPRVEFLREGRARANLLAKTIRRIGAVEPAPGEGPQVKSWLKDGRRSVRLIRRILIAAKREDFAKFTRLGRKLERTQRRALGKAKALGLPACSKGRTSG